MQAAGATLPRRPSLARLGAFALLCVLWVGCAWLLHRYSGIIFPFHAALVYGVFLFLLQCRSSAGTRGRWFYLAAAVFYAVVLGALSRRLFAYDDQYTGQLMLAASLVGWAAFWFTLHRRWPFPLFRLVLGFVVVLWAVDFYVAVLRPPMRSLEVVQSPVDQPRVLTWTPDGGAFYLNEDDEMTVRGQLHRFDLERRSHESLDFPGIVSQAELSPEGSNLAVVYEDKHRGHHLALMDPRGQLRHEIFSGPRGIYFPFRHTQSPWSPSGRHIVFAELGLGEAELRLYDRRFDELRHLGSGKSVNRAFWIDEERVAIPRGARLSSLRNPQMDWLEIRSASDARLLEIRPLDRSYDTLYAYGAPGVILFKQGPGEKFRSELDFQSAQAIPKADFSYLQAAFSPDGRWMAYPENADPRISWPLHPPNASGGTGVGLRGCRLRLYDHLTGQERVLYRSPIGSLDSIAWSPSGRWIAFSLRTDHWLSYGAAVILVSAETGKSYKVAWQHPTRIVDHYRGQGRKHLFWRPGHDHLLYWDVFTNDGKRTAVYRLILCPPEEESS